MKLSFMTFACPGYSLSEALDLATRHGYQGIEFRTDAGHQHGVEVTLSKAERAQTRRALADAGIEACCLATSLQYASAEAVAQTPALLELAADLGCPGMRVFCGPLVEGESIETAIPRVAGNLRRVAEQALLAGVRLWLETHDSISLGVHAGRIVRLVDHPSVAINWDNMHPFRNGEPLDVTWQAVGPFIQHTHFHDSVAEPGAPIITLFGEGGLPIQAMYNLLQQAGYDGYYSGEWFGEQMGPDPDSALENHKQGLLRLEQGWLASNQTGR